MRVALILSVLALTACVPEDKPADPNTGLQTDCGAEKLQHLIGGPASAHDLEAEGRPLRILPSGSVMTMDHRTERLNVDLDAEGVITRIWCG